MSIRNLVLDGANPNSEDFYMNGKRVTQMWLNGICVWDIGGFEITYNNQNGGIYQISLNCDFGKDVTVNWGTNYGEDKETIEDGSTTSHSMVWLENGVPAQYHTFTVSIDTDVDLVPNEFIYSQQYCVTSVSLPDSIKSIGYRAFNNCSALTDIKLPSKLETIGMNALSNCNLQSITIPDSVTSIGQYAFYYNSNLSNILLGTGLKTIEMGAFRKCNLQSITIPDSVTSIGNGAFGDNANLTKVFLNCEILSNNIFENDSLIESVKIGNKVKKIGVTILDDCQNLEFIEFDGTIEEWENIEFVGCPFWHNSIERYIKCNDGNIALPDILTRQAKSWKY